MTNDEETDKKRVQDRAIERRQERTEHVEHALAGTDELLGEHKYPTTSEELATEYADERLDLPNETESLGSVFDRLVDERYESAEEAREAVYNELTGEAGGRSEFNEERNLERLDEAESEDTTDTNTEL